MSKKPVITIPDTSKKPDAGLSLVKDVWYARYTEDGKSRRMSIGISSDRKPVLRTLRDSFYAGLLAAGATVAGPRGPGQATLRLRRKRAMEDPMKYLRHEPKVTNAPWSFRLGETVIGRYPDVETARAARNKKLGIR